MRFAADLSGVAIRLQKLRTAVDGAIAVKTEAGGVLQKVRRCERGSSGPRARHGDV